MKNKLRIKNVVAVGISGWFAPDCLKYATLPSGVVSLRLESHKMRFVAEHLPKKLRYYIVSATDTSERWDEVDEQTFVKIKCLVHGANAAGEPPATKARELE